MRQESRPSHTDRNSFVRRSPLIAYFSLAYAISWGLWFSMAAFSLNLKTQMGGIVFAVAVFGPTLAGLILTSILLGADGLRKLLARLSPAQAGVAPLLLAIFIPFLLIFIAITLSARVDRSPLTLLLGGTWLFPLLIQSARIFFTGGPFGEELGWRGFALPRLLADRTPLKASIQLGLLWGLWHAPIYFVPGSAQNDVLNSGGSFFVLFPPYVVWVIGMTILFTWLYKLSNGNLLISILLHTAVNSAAFLSSEIGVQSGVVPLLNTVLTWIAALLATWTRAFRQPLP